MVEEVGSDTIELDLGCCIPESLCVSRAARLGVPAKIEGGATNNPKVDYILGLYVSAGLPSKIFGAKPGVSMAPSDIFKIRILGKEATVQPNETVDSIFLAEVIDALRTDGSRDDLANRSALRSGRPL